MANTDNAHGFNFWKRLGPGASVPIVRVVTDSNVTLAIGDAVVLSGGLAVTAASSHPAIFGVAQEAVSGTSATRKSVAVIPALPDIIFEGQCDSGVSISAVGQRFKLTGTTGSMEVDSSTGGLTDSIAPIRVIGKKPTDDWSSHADLLFVWAASQFGAGVAGASLAG